LRSATRGAIVSVVTLVLTLVLVATSFVVGLAALVRMATPAGGGPDDVARVIRLPEPLTAAIVIVFAFAALVFLTDLVRRSLSRRLADEDGEQWPAPLRGSPWVRAVSQILSLLYFIVLASLVWRGAIPLADVMSLGQGAGSALGSALSRPIAATAPPLVAWTFGLLALVTGLGALALALWVAFGDRLARWWERPGTPSAPLEKAVEESLEDLRAERDARRAIIRCYSRFEQVAAGCGLPRKPWSTPMEFMGETLARLPVPRTAVPTLTALFELAQFSHHALGPRERDLAVEALDDIKVALEEGRADVAPR
jgi:hypothetical protein